MANPVTVGLDGSRESVTAACWAAREADLLGTRLELVHVQEEPGRPARPLLPVASTEVQRRWTEGLLHEARDEVRRLYPDLEVTSRRLHGTPATTLIRAAASSDMLVMGSRGLGSMAGFLLGSVALDTVVAADQPVVLVRSPPGTVAPADGCSTAGAVVAGVDLGRPCDALLAFAFAEASRHGCPLHLVHGWTAPPVLGYAPSLDSCGPGEMSQEMTTELSGMMSPWCDRFSEVKVDVQVRPGRPAIHLVEASHDAVLVVVGRRIRRSAYGAHIGPITHAVLHHAAAPVAVVAHE
ncbi:universal stress protein [Streptomyces subrutilus]|uniref:universal stress protein n=1 Tax=Streptomyces subrutilus TaxID=36818 RepID=UPI0034044483